MISLTVETTYAVTLPDGHVARLTDDERRELITVLQLHFTPEMDATLLSLVADGLDDDAIAARIGTTADRVHGRRRRLVYDQRERTEGATTQHAPQTHQDAPRLNEAVESDLPPTPDASDAADAPTSLDVPAEARRAIRECRAAGKTTAEIADRLKVPTAVVNRIVREDVARKDGAR